MKIQNEKVRIALMTLLLGASLAVAAEDMLYPIPEGKLWGYINAQGETVIKPIYKRAGFFSEGLALVAIGDADRSQAYIDTSGKVAIALPKGRRYMGEFSEGLAALKESENGNYGFIDKQGGQAIPFDYLAARGFSEGLAAVEVKEGDRYLRGYIDKQGKMVIPPVETSWRKSFADGRASARVDTPDGKLYGYLDASGELVVPGRYRKAGDFSEGRAFVVTQEQSLQLIDKMGEVVATLPFKKKSYGKLPVFSEGYAPAYFMWQEKGKPWGFIDRDGKIAFPHLDLWRIKAGFSEGLALVNPRGSKETLCIDTKGQEKFRLPQVKEVLRPFSGGVIAVQLKGERGITYYNNKGEVLWKQAP